MQKLLVENYSKNYFKNDNIIIYIIYNIIILKYLKKLHLEIKMQVIKIFYLSITFNKCYNKIKKLFIKIIYILNINMLNYNL